MHSSLLEVKTFKVILFSNKMTVQIDMTQNRPFAALHSGEQTQRNEDEALVDSFIQITVFCPPEPRVDAFVHMNAGKVYKSLF